MFTTRLVSLLTLAIPQAAAKGSWASIPIHGPPMLTDWGDPYYHWHYAEVLIGNPPQNQSLVFSTYILDTFIFNPDCLFCPSGGVFDPSLSVTWNDTGIQLDSTSNARLRGTWARDTISFGGIFQSDNVPIGSIASARAFYYSPAPRIGQGHLGLLVDPTNKRPNSSILWRLWSEGKLLNPVIGMNLGGHTNPRMSIGALDPNDFVGEINWVEASTDSFGLFSVDAVRGYQGNILPNIAYPALTALDSVTPNIEIPPMAWISYFHNTSLGGPREYVNIYLNGDQGASVPCNYTLLNPDLDGVHISFSVDINGVNYRVDTENLIRPATGISETQQNCSTAFTNSTIGEEPTIKLGTSFLRSVYWAYRFPTEDCPKAFYGFAFPKGANRTASELAQKPRATPTLASQCLNFAPAGSTTPTPTRELKFPVRTLEGPMRDPLPGERTWRVYKRPDLPEVVLRDIDGLPPADAKVSKQSGGGKLF